MKDIGLSKEQIEVICNVLKNYPVVEIVKLYGSRAKGNFNERSDIDLVAFGDNLDRFVMSEILMDFDDSDISFRIEIQDYKQIQNSKLKEHIDRVGVVLYLKD